MTMSIVSAASDKPETIAETLVQALRETQVETAKAQIYHWNVKGMSFGPLHALFQEIYEDHFAAQDTIAERAKALGSHVDGRLAEAVASSGISECDGSVDAVSMVRALADDQKTLSGTFNGLAARAEKNGDAVTADIAIERADVHDKFAWILKAHLET